MLRLLLIDGHAILHRAYHALPPLTTKSGQPIGAIYGFISILLRTIQNIKPTNLAVTFDMKEPTFRKKLFSDYQAQRPEIDENMVSQIVILHEILTKISIPIFEVSGFEADDVIGTLAKQSGNEETIIMTGDRDILQLVNKNIKVLMPVKGISEAKLFGEEEVYERMGVIPSEIVELKALSGDASDNYSGVPGIGPKTAIILIKKFRTLENIYGNIDKFEGKLKEKLIAGEESARMSKQLAKIITDVPVKLEWQSTKLLNLDRKDVRQLFEEWGFTSLITRLSGDNQIQKSKSKLQINSKIQNPKKEEGYKKKSPGQTSLF